ncbi:MAG: extracellular solute-binding protein [Methanoregulaceae archaeon]|nr:extracellular solute-binding protein [Methanoregulaceae archaeon]
MDKPLDVPQPGSPPPASTDNQLRLLLPVGVGFLALTCVVLAGVWISLQRSPAPPRAPKEVKLLVWTTESGSRLEQLFAWAEAFHAEHPEITLQVTSYEQGQLRENFQSSTLVAGWPDLLWTVNDHTAPFARTNLIRPVDNLGFDLGAFLPGALEAVRLDGKTWGIPMSVNNHLMLLYNKDLVRTPPKDTDELIRLAQQLTVGDGYGLAYNLDEPFWLVPWLGSYDGAVFSADGKMLTLNSPAMKNALQLLYDFKFKYQIVPQECDYGCADALFKEGRAAMIINGDWSLGEYQQALGDKLGAAALPQVSGAGWPKPYLAGAYLMFPRYMTNDQLNAAREFANYILSDQVQLGYVESGGQLPVVRRLLDDERIRQDPILSGSAEALRHAAGVPPQPEMDCNWKAIRPNLKAMMAGKLSPAEASEAMQTMAEECIGETQ